jgi:glycerophosphoryl diester phosphodiesterase
MAAFRAAIAAGYGIECDLRPARGGLPVVFHDETLERLTDASGKVASLGSVRLDRIAFKGQPQERIPTFAELLALVQSRAPLLIEIKSEWRRPNMSFLAEIARLATAYRGPIALMSFDPAVMTPMRELAPRVPRGIVSGNYLKESAEDHWWEHVLTRERAERLTHLLESGPAEPSFYAYDVNALPTPVTRYVREVQRMPLFAWTVRTPDQRKIAKAHADALIFEGLRA